MISGSDRAPTFGTSELLGLMEHRLGGGAFGTVYSLRGHPSLAVKEIRLDALDDRLARNAEFELSALARLSHPGILRCHQVIVDDSFIYIVMDRHDGTLECLFIEHKRKKTHVSNRLICSIARQIAGALTYLSSASGVDAKGEPFRGLVHRDLKPVNILVAADGEQFILADFGLCKDALRSGTTLAGTKPYMAPETLIYNSTSHATDIWSLGVIVYELATLLKPNFLGDKEPGCVFTSGWRPDLSPVKNDFIRGILERIFVLDPAKRPPAKELASLLQKSDVSGNRQQAYGTSLEDRCLSLEAALKDANARIAALEGQCKEHLTTTKALESRIALLTINNPQSGILLLPRLMRAAHTNNIETVRMLVEGGDGVGKRDEQGRTALMHAARQGHVEPARLLMEKEKGLQDRSGWTALMHAAHNNHSGVVEILAAHECGKRDSNGRTALMIAAERGYAEIVATLAPHEKGLADNSGNTALMLAASNAHIEAVRWLVEHEKGITDENGRTALVLAARAGHREITELLMRHEKDVTGWTTLMCAAALGDVDMVSQYINERGQKDKLGQTALILATQNGRKEVVKLLMKYEGGASGWTNLIYAAYLGDVDAVRNNLHEKGRKDITGMTALMWAAYQGHKEVVEVLLEHEKGIRDNQEHNALYWAFKNRHITAAEIIVPHEDPTDENGVSALMRAAARGDVEIVELLIPIQKGRKDKNKRTAFQYALENRHIEIATLLYEHEVPSWTPLMRAAFLGDIETVKQYLSDKDKKDEDGDTAYTLAAKAGQGAILELLDPTDEDGVTALMRAAESGDVEAVKTLIPLQKGKMARYVEINGWEMCEGTALMVATACENTKIVGLLVEHEGGMKDEDGVTALMFAAARGHVECVKLLLEKEAGMQDNDGWTALMRAAYNGHTEVVKLLVEHESGVQDEYGKTALIYAAENGHTDCIKLLVEKEARMQAADGQTALMWAAENNNLEHVKLLLEKEGGMQNNEGYTALMIAIQSNNVDCARLLAKKEGHIKRTYKRDNGGYSSAQICTETALDIAKANRCKAIIAILSE